MEIKENMRVLMKQESDMSQMIVDSMSEVCGRVITIDEILPTLNGDNSFSSFNGTQSWHWNNDSIERIVLPETDPEYFL